MKTLILTLLIPFAVFGQRVIGVKDTNGYKFEWDMQKVAQKTFDDLNSNYTVDSVYVMSDTTMQVLFSTEGKYYANIFFFDMSNDTMYTTYRSAGCLNSCRKEQECTRCSMASDCSCSCFSGYGSCSELNLAVFQSITISEWIKIRILTNQNPEE